MLRTLLVTNDFPPRLGGIQSYVYEIARRLPPERLVVLTSQHPEAAAFDEQQAFPVVRYPANVLLPTANVARQVRRLIADHSLEAMWYGAAAPLALLTPAVRSERISRTVASTHGHEVGWSMLPGSRQLLRRIGRHNDIVTFVSKYARGRISSALGAQAALEWLPPGVESEAFAGLASASRSLRQRYGLGSDLVIVCVSRLVRRKGQDVLIGALPAIQQQHPRTKLLIVGDGPDAARQRRLAAESSSAADIVFTGAVAAAELPAHFAVGDVFAMPCRTRGGGLDVEGLGIVFLEAAAAGLAVVVGDSGGAPETVRPLHVPRTASVSTQRRYDAVTVETPVPTGIVVPGRDSGAVTNAIATLLADEALRSAMGRAGQQWVQDHWTWQASADRLAQLLSI